METQNQQQGTAIKNGIAKETAKAPQNGETRKEAANPAEKTAAEPAKTAPATAEGAKAEAGVALRPKAEVSGEAPSTAVVQAREEAKTAKLGMNLQLTLKVVEDLHRRSVQRINLISRIKQLEDFEVTLEKGNDELEENPYQGCKLIIQDDQHRQFVTTTPGLIRMVSQFIFNACNEKLAEIEAHIVLPG